MYGPPEMAQAPTAMTIFGAGHGVVGLAQREPHVLGDRAGDEQPVGVARRGDELDAEPAEVPAHRVQHVDVELAGVAAAGAHLAQLERAAEQLAQLAPRAPRRARARWSGRDDQVLAASHREAVVVCRRRARPRDRHSTQSVQKRQRPRSIRGTVRAASMAPVGQASAQRAQPSGHFDGVDRREPAEALRQRRRRRRRDSAWCGGPAAAGRGSRRSCGPSSAAPAARHRSCPQ